MTGRAFPRKLVLAMIVAGSVAMPAFLVAQGGSARLPLQPRPPGGYPAIIPFFEGWYANEDGTYSFSFGYLNQRSGDPIMIPVGEDNLIEGGGIDGVPPTVFLSGRQRGVFAITVPGDMKDEDVWWFIRTPGGEGTRVPGRTSSGAYQLDWIPRPQGSRHPLVSFEGSDAQGRGPRGLVSPTAQAATVGSPVALTLNVLDPSERDPADHRFREPIPLTVAWSILQGPAVVEFSRHESTPEPVARGGRGAGGGAVSRVAAARAAARNRVNRVTVQGGQGTASVYVTFSEPGEYLLRAQVDNFGSSDSTGADQCCWTNAYFRVIVTQ